MNLAYVDTSCLAAIAFGEKSAARTADRLRRFDHLFSSNLLEAELRSALARERVKDGFDLFESWLTWIYPDRPLTPEFQRVVAVGHLKGADLWHLANALFIDPGAEELTFLSLDVRQIDVATKLGFTT